MESSKCPFCDSHVDWTPQGEGTLNIDGKCDRCGLMRIDENTLEDILNAIQYTEEQKNIISITLRNNYEISNKPTFITLASLGRAITDYKKLEPLDKIDLVLSRLENKATYVGSKVIVLLSDDYPYYHCSNAQELKTIFDLLESEKLILSDRNACSITIKGYKRLKELDAPQMHTNQCFVAMWFTKDMDIVFDQAIKKAIEYVEPGETTPRFKAIKINNVEHINDINDELIAQIRRSKFMVCDLTGYRGGVYFEAGFAYGLGLNVIYTCRKDWTHVQALKNNKGDEIKSLLDNEGNEIEIKKEGIHFDLAHRNRIEWTLNDLDDFRKKLNNRIRAIII